MTENTLSGFGWLEFSYPEQIQFQDYLRTHPGAPFFEIFKHIGCNLGTALQAYNSLLKNGRVTPSPAGDVGIWLVQEGAVIA